MSLHEIQILRFLACEIPPWVRLPHAVEDEIRDRKLIGEAKQLHWLTQSKPLVEIFFERKNWLFCWTELGAKHVGMIQSAIVTCRLHGIDP